MIWSVDTSSPVPLHEQIAGNVRRAVADGTLPAGERLAPASEVAGALGVHANTVLRAYRTLRDEDVLEFRRGRGVRVAEQAHARAGIHDAVLSLLELGRELGYGEADLAALLHRLARPTVVPSPARRTSPGGAR